MATYAQRRAREIRAAEAMKRVEKAAAEKAAAEKAAAEKAAAEKAAAEKAAANDKDPKVLENGKDAKGEAAKKSEKDAQALKDGHQPGKADNKPEGRISPKGAPEINGITKEKEEEARQDQKILDREKRAEDRQKAAEEREDSRWYAHQDYLRQQNQSRYSWKYKVINGHRVKVPGDRSSGMGRDIFGNPVQRSGSISLRDNPISTRSSKSGPTIGNGPFAHLAGGMNPVALQEEKSNRVQQELLGKVTPPNTTSNQKDIIARESGFLSKETLGKTLETAAAAAANGATVSIGTKAVEVLKPGTKFTDENGKEQTAKGGELNISDKQVNNTFTGSRWYVPGQNKGNESGAATASGAISNITGSIVASAKKEAESKVSALASSNDKELQQIAKDYVKQSTDKAANSGILSPAAKKAVASVDATMQKNREAASKPFSVADYQQRKPKRGGGYMNG